MDATRTSVSILDHAAVAAALAAQAPIWPPGTAHGYHPRTFGFLVDELLRRLRPGQTVGSYWRETFADPWAGHLDRPARRRDGSRRHVFPRARPRAAGRVGRVLRRAWRTRTR